jgi:hypothetical protein
MGFEPTFSTLTGWRALLAAPRGQYQPLRRWLIRRSFALLVNVSRPQTTSEDKLAQVGVEPTASLGLSKGGLPVAYRAGLLSSGGWSRTNISGFRARCPTG